MPFSLYRFGQHHDAVGCYFFFKQKTAYEMRISDWSSDVCSSDLHDAELVGRIAAATGRAVQATGNDWLFAPAVPVVQDARWGRTYESWSQDPALVREYADRKSVV